MAAWAGHERQEPGTRTIYMGNVRIHRPGVMLFLKVADNKRIRQKIRPCLILFYVHRHGVYRIFATSITMALELDVPP